MITSNILQAFQTAKETLESFISIEDNINSVYQFAKLVTDSISSGGKVITCGNGGSMCDAMHFAEELTGRFRNDRMSLPAIAIADASHITCTGNDYGFDAIFSRYVEGLGKPGDVLLGISTSGNSPNIIKAVEAAKQKEMKTVGLLGNNGGKMKDLVDLPIIVPADTSDRIQEVHIKIIHIVIETVEKNLGLA